MKNLREFKGITLVALVITIIILLILAGISIAQLSDNGVFENARLARERSIKAEMVESLTLALQELQLEKRGKATIDDITQEWIDSKLKDYKNTVTENVENNSKTVTMEKNDIIAKYIIDAKFGTTQIPVGQENIQFSYDVGERNENKVNITIKVQDKQNGLSKLEVLDTDTIIDLEQTKEEKEVNYEVEIGKEYKIKITSTTGEKREEKILIEKYYHKVTIDLSEGINIDNTATKAEYNKPYQATITVGEEYYLKTLTVKMGEENIAVDLSTGIINIESVTGDIEITTTSVEKANALRVIENGQPTVECKAVAQNNSSGTTTLKENCILMDAPASYSAYYCTKGKIDLSKYNTITLDYKITQTYYESASYNFDKYGSVGVWIRSNNDTIVNGGGATTNDYIKSDMKITGTNNYPIKERKQVTYDISDVQDEAYIQLGIHRCKVEFYNVTLE